MHYKCYTRCKSNPIYKIGQIKGKHRNPTIIGNFDFAYFSREFTLPGHSVFAINHPFAPEEPFPAALVSGLRALHFVRRAYGVKRVVLSARNMNFNEKTTYYNRKFDIIDSNKLPM